MGKKSADTGELRVTTQTSSTESCPPKKGALSDDVEGIHDLAIKGNVVDLVVGVIIGAAFSSVVNSLVNNTLMPPIGRLTGNVDFQNLFLSLNGHHYATLAPAKAAEAPTINYASLRHSNVCCGCAAFE